MQVPFALFVVPVGSRVTCNPPPVDTDRDWLVLIEHASWPHIENALLGDGWEVGGSICYDESALPQDHKFSSFTKVIDGVKENLIVTSSHVFYQRFLAASSIAKRLNLMNKADRVAVFQAVLYGNEIKEHAPAEESIA